MFSEVPYVVIAIVVSDPGEYFKECLSAAVTQTYENTSLLILDTGVESVASLVADIAPNAYYKKLPVGTGYPKAANKVLQSVQGATHLLFIHDDAVLEPNTTKLLLEGSYMYNCGIAGPKVVDMEDNNKLLSVGFLTDRFMVPVSISEPEEIDQGQYDQVREVVAVDGAAILIRSDLFKALKGFDQGLSLFAEDIDICVRAKATGATVYVLPEARVFHMAAISKQMRNPTTIGFRNGFEALRYGEIKTMLGVYSLPRAIWLFLVIICLSTIEIVGSYLVKKTARAESVLRVLLATFASMGSIFKQRNDIATYKTVTDKHLQAMQIKSFGRVRRIVEARNKGRGLLFDKAAVRTLSIIVIAVIFFFIALRDSLFYGFISNNKYITATPISLIGSFFLTGNHVEPALVVGSGNLVLGLVGIICFNSTSVALLVVMLFLAYLTGKNTVTLVDLLVGRDGVKSSIRLTITLGLFLTIPLLLSAFNAGDVAFLAITSLIPWMICKMLNGSKVTLSSAIGSTAIVYLATGFNFYAPIVLIVVGLIICIYILVAPINDSPEYGDQINKRSFSSVIQRYLTRVLVPSIAAMGLSIPWTLYAYENLIHNRLFNHLDSSISLHNLVIGGDAGYLLIIALVFSLISLVFMGGRTFILTSMGFFLLIPTLALKVVCEKGYFVSLPVDIFNAIVFVSLILIFVGVSEVFVAELNSRKFSWIHGTVAIVVVVMFSVFVSVIPQDLSGNSDIPIGIANNLPATVLNSTKNAVYVDARFGSFDFTDSQASYKFSNTSGFYMYSGNKSYSSIQGFNNSAADKIKSVFNEISQNNINDAGVQLSSLNIGWVIIEISTQTKSIQVHNLISGFNSQRDLQSFNSGSYNLLIYKNLEASKSRVQSHYIASNFKLASVKITIVNFIMVVLFAGLILIGLSDIIRRNYVKVEPGETNPDEI